jgi:hypothetical protein
MVTTMSQIAILPNAGTDYLLQYIPAEITTSSSTPSLADPRQANAKDARPIQPSCKLAELLTAPYHPAIVTRHMHHTRPLAWAEANLVIISYATLLNGTLDNSTCPVRVTT